MAENKGLVSFAAAMGSFTAVDLVYILLSGFAGIWEAWCFNYGRDDLVLIAVVVLQGLPFALLSSAHDRVAHPAVGRADAAPRWKRMLALWAGMPLSFLSGALSAGVTTVIVYAIAHPTDFPSYIPFCIGVAVACFAWTCCIRMWLIRPGMRLLGGSFFTACLVLIAGTVVAYGLSALILRTLHKDLWWSLTGVVITAATAAIIASLSKWSEVPAAARQ
jgi:hypothetical protein